MSLEQPNSTQGDKSEIGVIKGVLAALFEKVKKTGAAEGTDSEAYQRMASEAYHVTRETETIEAANGAHIEGDTSYEATHKVARQLDS